MTDPKRIQRKRTKGWRMPPNTVYVGRPTRWGNPWKIDPVRAKLGWDLSTEFDSLLTKYRQHANQLTGIAELRGKNLACWCPLGQPCHADVLLELANA